MIRTTCLCLVFTFVALGCWTAGAVASGDVNVSQDVNVTVRVNLERDSGRVMLTSPEVPRTRIPLLFESTYSLKTSQYDGRFLKTFADSTLPGLEKDQVIELLFQGCARGVQRGDLHLWVRRHDNYSTSSYRGRWAGGALSTGEPYRLNGLSQVISITHPAIFELGKPARRGEASSRLHIAQECGYKFVAVIREIRVDFMNPALPPTTAEFALDVWLGVFPAATVVVGPF